MTLSPQTEILIVTPVLDGAATLGRTLLSVASLAGPVRLVHHVQDGGSQDGTQALLERWARIVAWGGVGTGCEQYHFSWASVPDRGLYDAVARGFELHEGDGDQWLGWINSDDVLLSGAAGLLAAIDRDFLGGGPDWVGGRVRAAKGGHVLTEHDRPACQLLIREGLCDGLHFPPIQQEGVFFRRSLWRRIDPEADFARFKLAGDWNLWRGLAQHASLYQSDQSLGEFTLRAGQLSAVHSEAYLSEIEAELPFELRAEAFNRLANVGGLHRDRLVTLWGEERVQVQRERIDWLFDDAASRSETREVYARRERIVVRAPLRRKVAPKLVKSHGGAVIAHDADWQTPAQTERHAYKRIKELWPETEGWSYLGFPWATLIDLQSHWSERRLELEAILGKVATELPKGTRIITVCQHIHARRVAPLMAGIGVTDLFWSHAKAGEAEFCGLNVHPFPLFPVQRAEATGCSRDTLFSFVGARADQWYPTKTRNWIIDRLKGHRRGLIVERYGWHFDREVYGNQIRGEHNVALDAEALHEAEFRNSLARSVFVLCPAGTGPNTIRVWEALQAGAVPVILSDEWRPPGGGEMWASSAIFQPENEQAVRELPRELGRLARNKRLLSSLREGGRYLHERYGPDRFVTDIIDLLAGSRVHDSVN